MRKKKWSNKEIAGRIVVPILAVTVLCVAIAGVYTLFNKPTGIEPVTSSKSSSESSAVSSQPEVKEQIWTSKSGTTVVGIGTPITLSVEQDEETKGKFGYTAALPWKSGSMRLTVDEADIFPSVEESGIDPAELSYTPDEGVPFVLVTITLENIDAQFYEDMHFALGALISAEAFEESNVENGDLFSLGPIYFSDHRNSSESSRDYFHGELPTGSTKTFQLGFLSYEPQKELALKLGTNGNCHKYGVKLGLTS